MTDDQLEAEILSGAIEALQKRVARQRKLVEAGTGEAAIAGRIANVLDDLQREFSSAVPRSRAGR